MTTKQLLTYIIKEKSQGNTFQELNIQMKIMMKGINVKGIMDNTVPDNPSLTNRLKEIAKEFDINV